MYGLFAQATTSTTVEKEVQRIVGDPLSWPVFIGAGVALFAFIMIGGWLGHTRWNILRCLAGVEAGTGPDLALSHESVRNGVRGLPELFGRLPELEALLSRGAPGRRTG